VSPRFVLFILRKQSLPLRTTGWKISKAGLEMIKHDVSQCLGYPLLGADWKAIIHLTRFQGAPVCTSNIV
jgi:hypothetical protein